MGPARRLAFLGDDDGGRWFHPYGARDEFFGRATLALCSEVFNRSDWAGDAEDHAVQAAWWIGPRATVRDPHPRESASCFFENAGIAILQASGLHVIVDLGPFASGSAGHSHADTLSIVARHGEEELLIDPGTFTYVGDPALRNWFRGTPAHNTVSVDHGDQATPSGPFRWIDPPKVEVLRRNFTPDHDFLDAVCSYRNVRHRRRILLLKAGVLFVVDEVDGPSGDHRIEQSWHLAANPARITDRSWRIGSNAVLTMAPADFSLGSAWRSRAFGSKEETPVIVASRAAALPTTLAVAISFAGTGAGTLEVSKGLIFESPELRVILDFQDAGPVYDVHRF